MNFYTEDFADYLKEEWGRVMSSGNGLREARFIIESLSPQAAFDLFSELEEHRLKVTQNHDIDCYFRIATGLWREWEKRDTDAALIAKMRSKNWIDEEDQLTFYRSITLPKDKDGLVVVLVGLNHASDQGSLADFHLVDEARVWKLMTHCFTTWVRRISDRLGLDATNNELGRFEGVLNELFKVRPLQLARLAEFVDVQFIVLGMNFSTLTEVIENFYQNLPYWDIPPLLDVENNKKSADLIEGAESFISHQHLKTPAEQKKTWSQIEAAIAEERLELPQTLAGATPYQSVAEFRDTLRDYIFDADAEAKQRLMQTDIYPLTKVLKSRKKTAKAAVPDKAEVLFGSSVDVILQGIWHAWRDFSKQQGKESLSESVCSVRIIVDAFQHDLNDDPDGGRDGDGLAKELLRGCLGGLEALISGMDLRLPVDSAQAQQARVQWECLVPVTFELDLEQEVSFGAGRATPHVRFHIEIVARDPEQSLLQHFKWSFGPNHPERVRFSSAKHVVNAWPQQEDRQLMLPAFQLPSVVMAALYFAVDEEEANRLLSQALTNMELVNLALDITQAEIDGGLLLSLKNLIIAYHKWLRCFVDHGYYQANHDYFLSLQKEYEVVAKMILNKQLRGAELLLRRFYKAFLLVDERMVPNDAYLRAAVAWGISPPVMELTDARARFLCDSFPEILAEQDIGRNAGSDFGRLLNLVQIRRPLAALIVDKDKTLSAAIKSFGLLHYLGGVASAEKSLAVQTLLRDEEIDDDVADTVRATEDSEVVARVLKDYLQLYAVAEDGMRILAVHVEDLATILSGVEQFLASYLKCSPAHWPAFQCEVMIYSKSSSPMAVENKLVGWRDHVVAAFREKGRTVVLSVGHHFAPDCEKIKALILQESRLYDVAFLMRFLTGELTGDAESALPFKYDLSNIGSISKFPICEYPRPIQKDDALRRQSLLSNRRLRIQTLHADLSARLCHPQNPKGEHLIFGQVDYQRWHAVVEELHKKAHWVACIDPFVDKRLLGSHATNGTRKIVGFSSGLGAHGELNLSISTELDTLTQLSTLVRGHLKGLLPFQPETDFDSMAGKIVQEAEEIIGLSSLRAVVGNGEKIREVVGFAAIHRALRKMPSAAMVQLLPIDSVQHWFASSDVSHRPDLLQLSLILREDNVPLIHALVIECKFAQKNDGHLQKAREQVHDGLRQLSMLFAPNIPGIPRISFDRRYWWAQLHRAITSRSVVDLSEQDRQKLDSALEQLAEGYYEIRWKGSIFTFWTDEPGPVPVVTEIKLPEGVISPLLAVPEDFSVTHVAIGYKGVTALFGYQREGQALEIGGSSIRLSPVLSKYGSQEFNIEAVASASIPKPTMTTTHPLTSTSEATPTSDMSAAIIENIDSPPAGETTLIFSKVPKTHALANLVGTSNTPVSALTSLTSAVPSQILIGHKNNGEAVFWHYGHPQLSNRHMLIFGNSGFGKTYGIQCLLAEMARQNLHSLIVDYTDGFLPSQVELPFKQFVRLKNNYIYNEKLPLNPFQAQKKIVDPSLPLFIEAPFGVATRVASIFNSVYESMGDQQTSALIRVVEQGIIANPAFSMSDIPDLLRQEGSQSAESLASKLDPFIRSQPFRSDTDSSWESMLSSADHWVNVLQLTTLARDIQKLVTEFALWNLYDYACSTGNKNRPIPIVLDEIQNLDHRSDSPIDKMMREGRKFGLSLILATQTISNFDQEQRDRLFQAGHKLFFKPATTEIPNFAAILSTATNLPKADWAERLSKLEKGQCWSLGPALSSSGVLKEVALLVSITSLEKRGFEDE